MGLNMDNLLKTSLKVLTIFDWLERRSIYQDLELKEVHKEFKQAILDAQKQKEKINGFRID